MDLQTLSVSTWRTGLSCVCPSSQHLSLFTPRAAPLGAVSAGLYEQSGVRTQSAASLQGGCLSTEGTDVWIFNGLETSRDHGERKHETWWWWWFHHLALGEHLKLEEFPPGLGHRTSFTPSSASLGSVSFHPSEPKYILIVHDSAVSLENEAREKKEKTPIGGGFIPPAEDVSDPSGVCVTWNHHLDHLMLLLVLLEVSLYFSEVIWCRVVLK